jgi:hypothetical protein
MGIKIKVDNTSRIICIITTIVGNILNGYTILYYHLFLFDLEFFDRFGFNRVSKNHSYNICTNLNCGDNKILFKTIFNSFLILLFFFQHICFAHPKFKVWIGNYVNYLVYERGFYILSKYYL